MKNTLLGKSPPTWKHSRRAASQAAGLGLRDRSHCRRRRRTATTAGTRRIFRCSFPRCHSGHAVDVSGKVLLVHPHPFRRLFPLDVQLTYQSGLADGLQRSKRQLDRWNCDFHGETLFDDSQEKGWQSQKKQNLYFSACHIINWIQLLFGKLLL